MTSSPPGHLLIRASAGTGKTFQLSNRYLRLTAAGVAPELILASTFTRKAAGEILDRILIRLAEAASHPARCAELGTFLGIGKLTPPRATAMLAQLVRNLHRLRVSTLDSFFSQIATSYSLELGLPPGWRMVDELEERLVQTEAIDALLRGDDLQTLLNLFHLLTKGEAARGVSELVRSTVDDLYSLFCESSPEAWRKFPKFATLSDAELTAILQQMETLPLPKHKGWLSAHEKHMAQVASADWAGLLGGGIAAKVLNEEEKFYGKPVEAEVAALYGRLITHAKGVFVERIARQTEATWDLLSRYHEHFTRLKHQRRGLRFDDVTRSLAQAELLQTVDHLSFRLDSGIDHLLLDEFQDTSLAQWQVIRPLAKRVTTLAGGSFFCVGDVKQAIYGWRGGVAEIFDAVDAELTGIQLDKLETSYRSSPAVIESVNRIFSGAGAHPAFEREQAGVEQWSRQFGAHQTARTDLSGYVTLETSPEVEEDESKSARALDYAAERIAEIAARSPGRSIGVLVRTNKAIGELIFRLQHRGLPASEEGGNPLTDSAAVQLILSLLCLTDHPGNTVARAHVAASAWGQAMGLVDYGDTAAAVRLGRETRRRLVEEGYGVNVARWAGQLARYCSQRELNRLQQLIELAYQYDDSATLRADDFVEVVQTERVADPSSRPIRVMTVHQSKGLEFDIVVLPQLDQSLVGQPPSFVVDRPTPTSPIERIARYANADVQKLLPAAMQKMFEDHNARATRESLCVLYVALTRAVHALHMIIPPSTKSERKLPRSYAGLLRAALTDGEPAEPEQILFELGDPHWAAASPSAESPPGEPAVAEDAGVDAPLPAVTLQLAPANPQRRRGLERRTPSSLEGGSRVRLADLLQTDQNAIARQRGALMHAWLEQILWLDDGPPAEEKLRSVAARLQTAGLDLDSQLRQFANYLAEPGTAALLRRQTYERPVDLPFSADIRQKLDAAPLRAEVHAERTFVVRDDEALLTGSIDRLVLLYHGDRLVAADVIDFKTDVVAADDAAGMQRSVAFYRPQLAAYRRAVSRSLGLAPDRIATRLLYVRPGIVKNL